MDVKITPNICFNTPSEKVSSIIQINKVVEISAAIERLNHRGRMPPGVLDLKK
jgi:hypothetical protein